VLSRIVDYTDRNTCVLVRRRRGAVVLRPCATDEGILASTCAATEIRRGAGDPGGDLAQSGQHRTVQGHEHFIRMQGKKLFPFAVRSMEESMRRCMEQAGVSVDQLEVVIPHQATPHHRCVRERMGLRPRRCRSTSIATATPRRPRSPSPSTSSPVRAGSNRATSRLLRLRRRGDLGCQPRALDHGAPHPGERGHTAGRLAETPAIP